MTDTDPKVLESEEEHKPEFPVSRGSRPKGKEEQVDVNVDVGVDVDADVDVAVGFNFFPSVTLKFVDAVVDADFNL